jgi:hypothetical protein
MDIDTLVMRADPAKNRAPLHGTSATAQWTYGQITRVGGRVAAPTRLTVPVAAIVAAVTVTVVAAVLFVHLVPALNGPRESATSVLDQAAVVALHQPAQQPGPGQYLYSESKSLYQITIYQRRAPSDSKAGSGPGAVAAAAAGAIPILGTVQYLETEQSWTDSRGAGRSLLTRGALQYPSVADKSAWNSVAAGRQFASSFQQTVDDPSPSPADVSGLSTHPAILSRQLARGADGLSTHPVDHGPSAVFERAALLLVAPNRAMTPALESALYKVLAHQRGVTVLGTTTDHSGREGTGISSSSATAVTEVIIDPDTGAVLESQFPAPMTVATPPTGEASVSCRGCAGRVGPINAQDVISTVTPQWTDTESTAIVNSSHSTQPVPASTP